MYIGAFTGCSRSRPTSRQFLTFTPSLVIIRPTRIQQAAESTPLLLRWPPLSTISHCFQFCSYHSCYLFFVVALINCIEVIPTINLAQVVGHLVSERGAFPSCCPPEFIFSFTFFLVTPFFLAPPSSSSSFSSRLSSSCITKILQALFCTAKSVKLSSAESIRFPGFVKRAQVPSTEVQRNST